MLLNFAVVSHRSEAAPLIQIDTARQPLSGLSFTGGQGSNADSTNLPAVSLSLPKGLWTIPFLLPFSFFLGTNSVISRNG